MKNVTSTNKKPLMLAIIAGLVLLLLLGAFLIFQKNNKDPALNATDLKNSLATTSVNEKSSVAQQAGYAVGFMAAKDLKATFVGLNHEDIIQGIKDGYNNQSTLSEAQMASAVTAYNTQTQDQINAENKIIAKDNLQKSESFLNGVKAQGKVKETASGVLYQVLKEGTGAAPKPSDAVTVIYETKDTKGNVIDSSNGEPVQFIVSDLITGWADGLANIKEGGQAILYVPPKMAYGEEGDGYTIAPNSVLIFDVKLIKVGENKNIPLVRPPVVQQAEDVKKLGATDVIKEDSTASETAPTTNIKATASTTK